LEVLTYKTVLLDLDGTLVDSAPGIVSSIAHVLETLGKPIPPMRDLLRWVGPPLPESFQVRGGLDASEIPQALKLYRAHYLDTGAYDSKLFDGMGNLLRSLKNAGANVALATSKPLTPASIMLRHFTLTHYFDVVAAAADDESRGAKDQVIEDALATLRAKDLDTSSIIMVGDRIHDVEGARAHGIDTIMVHWGYGGPAEWARAEHSVDTPRQLHQALGIPGGSR
jgi:phosphoglycolate phosphatase